MEDPVVVLEVVKPKDVDKFSDDDSIEVIPALKRGGVDADSDNEESVESKDSDDESGTSKESDDASESGKKVTWVVDKPTTSIRVCKSTHMYFLYPFLCTIIP